MGERRHVAACGLAVIAWLSPALGAAQPDTQSSQAGEAAPEEGRGSEAQKKGSGSESGKTLPEGHPPVGPLGAREQIDQARKRRAQDQGLKPNAADEDSGSASDRAGPPRKGRKAASPHGQGKPNAAAVRRALGQGPRISKASKSAELDPGTVRVRVVDAQDRPVEGASVRLGTLKKGGDRGSRAATTNAEGRVVFSELATGGKQAYRVTVPYEGAQYGSKPFRLGGKRGYDVRIRRLPVTRNDRALLLQLGHTELSIKKGQRLHVIQQYRLTNLGRSTYVFPSEGKLVRLPADFTGFQSRKTMGDQELEKTDAGFRIRGSVPPGTVSLTWAFDVPIEGKRIELDYPVPWRTFRYRVAAEASKGMELEAKAIGGGPNFTAPREHTHQGKRLLVAGLQRRPEDPPLQRVRIELGGIPGPGPLRWIALGGALVLVVAGVMLGIRGGREAQGTEEARENRKQELLDEAAEIERMHAAGEIGPNYRRRRMEAVTLELAALLRQEAASRATSGSGSGRSASKTGRKGKARARR